MNNAGECDAPRSEPADINPTPDSSGAEPTHITLRLSVEEGRWLVTALNVAIRLLEGVQLRRPEGQRFQIQGLAALHGIANQLPSGLSGYYPSSSDLEDVSE
jgi:hypothetical protein